MMVEFLFLGLEAKFAVSVVTFELIFFPFSFVVCSNVILEIALIVEGSVTIRVVALVGSFSDM
jgi:hypothetical protein